MKPITPTITCDVIHIEQLNHHVYRVLLKPYEPLIFNAGQYIEIVLPTGDICAFSIANAPHQELVELHIRHNVREALSTKIIEHVNNNKTITILGNKGECSLVEDPNKTIIFIAASTCFAQIKSLLEFAFNKNFKQPLYFYWGVRFVNDFYLKEIPDAWATQHPNFTFVPVVSQKSPKWHGRHGFVHKAVMQDFPTLKDTQVYACGSPNMIYAVRDDFVLHGLDETQFFSDVFDYAQRQS